MAASRAAMTTKGTFQATINALNKDDPYDKTDV
jgi:hypothetical protein